MSDTYEVIIYVDGQESFKCTSFGIDNGIKRIIGASEDQLEVHVVKIEEQRKTLRPAPKAEDARRRGPHTAEEIARHAEQTRSGQG